MELDKILQDVSRVLSTKVSIRRGVDVSKASHVARVMIGGKQEEVFKGEIAEAGAFVCGMHCAISIIMRKLHAQMQKEQKEVRRAQAQEAPRPETMGVLHVPPMGGTMGSSLHQGDEREVGGEQSEGSDRT